VADATQGSPPPEHPGPAAPPGGPAASRAALLTFIASDPALAALLAEVRHRASAADASHDLDHLLRVALWTLRCDPALEPRLAVAAALLHDAVHVPKDHPDRSQASERSAELARDRLAAHGFGPAEVALAAEAIRDHSFSRGAEPASDLGRALQDADRLEALGAIGLARCFATGAAMGATLFDPEDPWAERRPLDDRRHSVDHFFTKLLRLPETMRTPRGRVEAARRAMVLRAYLEALAAELGGPPPAAS
jgi:uncharacterized protein